MRWCCTGSSRFSHISLIGRWPSIFPWALWKSTTSWWKNRRFSFRRLWQSRKNDDWNIFSQISNSFVRGSLYRLLLTSSVIQFALIYPLVSYPLVTDRVYFLFILYYGETEEEKKNGKEKKKREKMTENSRFSRDWCSKSGWIKRRSNLTYWCVMHDSWMDLSVKSKQCLQLSTEKFQHVKMWVVRVCNLFFEFVKGDERRKNWCEGKKEY